MAVPVSRPRLASLPVQVLKFRFDLSISLFRLINLSSCASCKAKLSRFRLSTCCSVLWFVLGSLHITLLR